MCGIVGYVGTEEAGPILMDCLRRLEYRGYDSAGIGVLDGGSLQLRRSVGKIAGLERLLRDEPVRGTLGVAHTRWATHGRPSEANAHPHGDCAGGVLVVHNGIIENHRALRQSLEADSHRFRSDTDTEVVAHLLEGAAGNGNLAEAARAALVRLEGAYALGIVSRGSPGMLLAARRGGPPLVVGCAPHGTFVASDIAAILPHTRDVLVVEDGELAIVRPEGVRLLALDGRSVSRTFSTVPWSAEQAEKQGYPHFMLKEIHEQPRAVADTLRGRLDTAAGEVLLPELELGPEALRRLRRVVIVACGTSWHAGLAIRSALEGAAGLPVEVELASEFRYREPLVDAATLCIAVSQSGETADTLGALAEARWRGARTLAICNVVGSSLGRAAESALVTRAGPEIGVASTKAFTAQIAALLMLAVYLGRGRGALDTLRARELLRELQGVPRLLQDALGRVAHVEPLARRLAGATSALYLGRGVGHALALEGALKLKEISYIHAEGYAAGEMKHGPIALVDAETPVVVLNPGGRHHAKTLGTIEEVKARDGAVLALADEGDEETRSRADYSVCLPRTPELLQPLLLAIPLQLLAYRVACIRGCDVDQPRNLAKSVTVD